MQAALRIKKPSKVKEGIHAILYGDPKTGKTSTLDDQTCVCCFLTSKAALPYYPMQKT